MAIETRPRARSTGPTATSTSESRPNAATRTRSASTRSSAGGSRRSTASARRSATTTGRRCVAPATRLGSGTFARRTTRRSGRASTSRSCWARSPLRGRALREAGAKHGTAATGRRSRPRPPTRRPTRRTRNRRPPLGADVWRPRSGQRGRGRRRRRRARRRPLLRAGRRPGRRSGEGESSGPGLADLVRPMMTLVRNTDAIEARYSIKTSSTLQSDHRRPAAGLGLSSRALERRGGGRPDRGAHADAGLGRQAHESGAHQGRLQDDHRRTLVQERAVRLGRQLTTETESMSESDQGHALVVRHREARTARHVCSSVRARSGVEYQTVVLGSGRRAERTGEDVRPESHRLARHDLQERTDGELLVGQEDARGATA